MQKSKRTKLRKIYKGKYKIYKWHTKISKYKKNILLFKL